MQRQLLREQLSVCGTRYAFSFRCGSQALCSTPLCPPAFPCCPHHAWHVLSRRCSMQVTGSLSDAKYACSISDEVAEKMAKNVKVSLKEYVLYV